MTPITAQTSMISPSSSAPVCARRKMVVLDIDGTLTEDRSRTIPVRTRVAIAAASRDGHQIVLASGRSLTGLLPIASHLGLTGPVVASNGAVTARTSQAPPGFVIEHKEPLGADQVLLAAVQLRLPNLQVAVEAIGQGYRVSERFPDGLLNGAQAVLPMPELGSLTSPRIVLRAPGVHALIKPLQAVGLTATPAGVDWIDVTPGGVSKATALERVRQSLGIDRADTIAVGDGINDLQMLAWAERGVAMGHAPAEVIDVADEVTGTLEEQGVVQVLRSVLPRSVPVGRW